MILYFTIAVVFVGIRKNMSSAEHSRRRMRLKTENEKLKSSLICKRCHCARVERLHYRALISFAAKIVPTLRLIVRFVTSEYSEPLESIWHKCTRVLILL